MSQPNWGKLLTEAFEDDNYENCIDILFTKNIEENKKNRYLFLLLAKFAKTDDTKHFDETLYLASFLAEKYLKMVSIMQTTPEGIISETEYQKAQNGIESISKGLLKAADAASKHNNMDYVNKLLMFNFQLTKKTNFDIAIKNNLINIIQFYISSGQIDINTGLQKGVEIPLNHITPLMKAVELGNAEIVNLLTSNGAEPSYQTKFADFDANQNIINERFESAVTYAIKYKNENLLNLPEGLKSPVQSDSAMQEFDEFKKYFDSDNKDLLDISENANPTALLSETNTPNEEKSDFPEWVDWNKIQKYYEELESENNNTENSNQENQENNDTSQLFKEDLFKLDDFEDVDDDDEENYDETTEQNLNQKKTSTTNKKRRLNLNRLRPLGEIKRKDWY